MLKRSPQTAVVLSKTQTTAVPGQQLASAVLERATPDERAALLFWAQQLLAVRGSSMSRLEKAKRAILITIELKAVLPFITFLGAEIKRVGWDERGLPARMALSAAAVAGLLLSGHGAGIAALGGAIGVPLWVVFGAGAAFAGVIIEEVKRSAEEPQDFKSTQLQQRQPGRDTQA